ncbi:MAG TPA: rRNA maturation RNase YbeY [Patescibacteria group bacterium]|nr:rRNA maturation RNase YbeY [Patescibacteria group bacterium]
MDKVNVLIFVESRYRINRKRIKSVVEKVIVQNEITSPTEVSVAVVGDRKMKELSRKYKGEDKTHNVLSFSQTDGTEAKSSSPAINFPRSAEVLQLGDIVISFPEVIREASAEEVLVDDKVDELVEHGLQHLLGIHHEE